MKLLTVFCGVLLAGVCYARTRPVSGDAGGEISFSVIDFMPIVSCHLKTPAGDTLDFIAGDESHQNGDRYELQPITIGTSMQTCTILVKDLQETDNGLWEMSVQNSAGQGGTESYEVTVITAEIDEPVVEEIEDDNINWLNDIAFPTRVGEVIDISLPKTDHVETCSVKTPDGDNLKASEVEEGVTVHESSDYVSCRITIGPMTENLLGKWSVCGTYTENEEEHERCQPATISWNNVNLPGSMWHSRTQPQFDHPVDFGFMLSPVVTGFGEVLSCHVVTPEGENLVITKESNYPKIRANTIAHSTCGITFGPIDRAMLGKWTVYGRFRNAVEGLTEEHLPISMFLYDEDDPYSQAYNVTILEALNRVVNLGNTVNLEVNVNAGQVDSCTFETPSGQVYDMGQHESFTGASFVNVDTDVACRIAIGPITSDLLGYWKIIGKFSNNGIFTERHQTLQIIQEDPDNPIEDEDRIITNLNAQTSTTGIGGYTQLIIHSETLNNAESCHIRTPNGRQYKIMEGFSVTGVEVIDEQGVECGVIIKALSEDVVGNWTLIARATRLSNRIERRLPVTINVEESVDAVPNRITITEGNDLVVRLKHPIDQHETCRLIGPFGFECKSAERDPLHVDTCGFIKKNLETSNNGKWTIEYGNKFLYKAEINVTVMSLVTLNLVRGQSVEEDVGPEDAVYCRLEDPQGFATFDGFGRCKLSLESVGLEHHGEWRMLVGSPGRILTDELQLRLNVRESDAEHKALVRPTVQQNKPIVTISCAVDTEAEVHACKFRDPQGRVLLAANGTSEDRYTFHGTNISYESEVTTHNCGIQIMNPLVTDLGLWRCAIETAEDTYYGHFSVLCPFALNNTETAAAVQQEPLLTVERSVLEVVEEETATLSCYIQSAIRYCYFRAANGTTFTVTPGTLTSSLQYAGAGLDAGECGIRMRGLQASDSGRWSCHVGLDDDSEEQRAELQLTVHERMRVAQYLSEDNTTMTVEGVVHGEPQLEYCRFVRIDGFGFTTDAVPVNYTIIGGLDHGECRLSVRDPTILDRHPWTVAAGIQGRDELARETVGVFDLPVDQNENDHIIIVMYKNGGAHFIISLCLYVTLISLLVVTFFGSPKNRKWTAERASAFRRSLSNSFRKKPLPPADKPAPDQNV